MESGRLTLHSMNEESGTAKEEVEISYSSNLIETGFNYRYVLEMLSSIEGETIQFVFADNIAPALVKDTADEGATYVIMPMRV